MNYMMNPIIMVLDKSLKQILLSLDKYDFDAAKLNKKIGFWGSKFFLSGFLLAIVIGIMGTPHPVAGVADADKWEWLLGLVEPWFDCRCLLGIVLINRFLVHRSGRTIVTRVQTICCNVFKGRNLTSGFGLAIYRWSCEIWACANVLAPIMLIEAVLLSTKSKWYLATCRYHRYGCDSSLVGCNTR